MPSCFPTSTLDTVGLDAGPSGTRPAGAERPAAGRALTTAEANQGLLQRGLALERRAVGDGEVVDLDRQRRLDLR